MTCEKRPTPIIRGTTPTITMRFNKVNVLRIVEAWLTIKQAPNGAIIEKDISTAALDENALSWMLTQDDTLGIKPSSTANVEIQCRYLLQDGTAGASPVYKVTPYDILRDGVIT